jgi:predicted ABC-type ATPase
MTWEKHVPGPVKSLPLSPRRVAKRVKEGGHPIPNEVIEPRFDRSLAIYSVCIAVLPTLGLCTTIHAAQHQHSSRSASSTLKQYWNKTNG